MEEQSQEKQIFHVLSRISMQMTSILDVDELITFFVSSVAKVFNADRASLMLLDQIKKELFIKAAHGFGPSEGSEKIKLGEMFAGWVAQQQEPLLVKDVQKEFPDLIKGKSSKYNSKSFVIVPVKIREGVVGILSVTDRKDNSAFTKQDLEIMNTLCHWLAIHMENIQLFEKNINLITIDSLTRLFNHRYCHEQLVEEIYRAQRYQHPLSIAMIDIDNFAKYNQTYGYSAGDSVLKQVGRIMKENIRRADLAARYGPEEFMLILPHTSIKQAIFVGEKIREVIGYSVIAKDKTSDSGISRLTVSVGVTEYKIGLSKETFIKQAHDALLLAKQRGKNRVSTLK